MEVNVSLNDDVRHDLKWFLCLDIQAKRAVLVIPNAINVTFDLLLAQQLSIQNFLLHYHCSFQVMQQ